jgi:AcrR family transcriptional regulator
MKEQTGGAEGMADQRREQMLQAALDVIVERGYPDTRITDVAERAGASPALVIYYFKTRDHLLTEAMRYAEDAWYAAGLRRIAAIGTAAGQLEEVVAMTCLPEEDTSPSDSWLLWLDLWAQSARNPGVSAVWQKFEERWRETIKSLVLAGQEAGEFAPVDAGDFAILLSALLDGFAVQIALEDTEVTTARAFELTMRFASDRLGIAWNGRRTGK